MEEVQDLLTENQVIEGVQNFLYQKGHTTHRRVVTVADAARKEHGVDLIFKLENDNHKGNTYFIEDNWALKHLRLRLYGAFCQDGKLTAVEYLPKDLYK